MVSKKEARAQGMKRYYTGKPCPKGHLSEKYVSNDACIACLRLGHKQWAGKNREKVNTRIRRWRVQNPEANREAYIRWQRENPKRCKLNKAVWYILNKGPNTRARSTKWRAANLDLARAMVRDWSRRHPEKCAAYQAKRRADQLQRTPIWADLEKIEEVYREAVIARQMFGEPWHVDHVIPLRGKRVSGLHIHTNLQLLPGPENIRKGNRYENVI